MVHESSTAHGRSQRAAMRIPMIVLRRSLRWSVLADLSRHRPHLLARFLRGGAPSPWSRRPAPLTHSRGTAHTCARPRGRHLQRVLRNTAGCKVNMLLTTARLLLEAFQRIEGLDRGEVFGVSTLTLLRFSSGCSICFSNSNKWKFCFAVSCVSSVVYVSEVNIRGAVESPRPSLERATQPYPTQLKTNCHTYN